MPGLRSWLSTLRLREKASWTYLFLARCILNQQCSVQNIADSSRSLCCLLLPLQNVPQGRLCFGNSTSYHTKTEVADPICKLTQSQYTDTGPASPDPADPKTPGAWHGSHLSTNAQVPNGQSGVGSLDLPLSRLALYHLATGMACGS